MNIFVSNLNFKVRSEDLKNLFQQYGEVVNSKVITDKFSGKSRGFGFVEMKNDDEGQRAITELDQKDFEGRNITVSVAKPKTEGGGNGGGGRDRDNRGGGGGFRKGNDFRE
jgi:RNA recognition motif-containing protein